MIIVHDTSIFIPQLDIYSSPIYLLRIDIAGISKLAYGEHLPLTFAASARQASSSCRRLCYINHLPAGCRQEIVSDCSRNLEDVPIHRRSSKYFEDFLSFERSGHMQF